MALNSVLSVTVLVLISDLNNPLTVYVCYKTSQSMTYLNSFWNKIIVSPATIQWIGPKKNASFSWHLCLISVKKILVFIFLTKRVNIQFTWLHSREQYVLNKCYMFLWLPNTLYKLQLYGFMFTTIWQLQALLIFLLFFPFEVFFIK